MQIQIDIREKELIALSKENTNTNYDIIHKSLPIGDIILTKDGKELVIIERKTVKDLAASIKDGRYKEQSARLDATDVPNHNILYIIEGSLNTLPDKYKINKSTILSSMVSLTYFKGFSLFRTNSVLETYELIIHFSNKLGKTSDAGYYTQDGSFSKNEIDYASLVKREKKANITPDNIDVLFLCQIPGVSTTVANSILKHFGTLYLLTDCLKKNENCLENMTYMSKDNKERKISKKVLETITKFLCK